MKKKIAKLLAEATREYKMKGIWLGKRTLKNLFNSDIEFRKSVVKGLNVKKRKLDSD
jgi:hypothetical protein